jgi:hypothetical protein
LSLEATILLVQFFKLIPEDLDHTSTIKLHSIKIGLFPYQLLYIYWQVLQTQGLNYKNNKTIPLMGRFMSNKMGLNKIAEIIAYQTLTYQIYIALTKVKND